MQTIQFLTDKIKTETKAPNTKSILIINQCKQVNLIEVTTMCELDSICEVQ